MEREVDHVRVLNRGILEFFPPVGVDEQADASRAKSLDVTNPQIVAHSSLYGVTILSTPQGLAIARFQTLEEATNTSVEKRDSNLDPLFAMPVDVVVDLPTSPYLLSLSPSQKLLAIAFDSSLAIFEVARLVDPQATKKPICLCNGADALSMSWCMKLNGNGDDQWIAVLTTSRQIHVYNMQGNLECLEGSIEATAHCWSPTESILAVGDDEGVIHKLQYSDTSFTEVGTLVNPENSDNAPVHHINWAEEDLLFAGYRIGDIDDVQVTACVFDSGTEVALDTVVDFFPSETREHTFYSCYLEPWRMFFVGCSLSTDIELLVSDPETNEWQKWKPEEKYTPRLPMTSDDNDTYPVGMALVLNSTTDIPGDNCQFYPCPLVLCATTDGKLLNFALLDISVGEPLDFLAAPSDIGAPSRPTVDAPWTTSNGNKAQEEQRVVFGVSTTAPSFSFESKDDAYGKGTDNVFADDDDEDDDDEEEERREEEEKAKAAFDAVDKKGKGTIPLTDFEKLFEALGTVYSAEEHTRTIHKLDRKGVIRKEDFVAWYVQWIFADVEDDDDDDDDANAGAKDVDPNAPIKSEAEIKAAFAKFAPPSGSWKCEVCMIMNPTAGAPKCISCDSPNPSATKSAPAAPAAGFGAFVAPPGSFKGFAVSSTDKPTGFGAPTSAPSGAQAFSFGVPSQPPASTPSSFSFGVPSQPASSAPSSFSFGVPAQSTPSTPAAFSFGVNSEPAKTEKTSNKEYGSDTNNVYVEDDDDDSDDEEDRKEEEEKVSTAFDKVDTTHSGKIPVADFEKLFEALGTVYSADEHTRTLKKLERAGYVHKSDFVTWYITWIFADEDESDEEEATSVPDVDPSATIKSEAERKAAFAKFQAPTGSWKCETCMIMNTDPKAAKCASCETPNPNAPKETKSATSSSASPFGAGGFTPFGVSTEKKTFGFGVTSTPDEKTRTPSAAPSTAQPTFSFGVPSNNNPPAFSFGVKTEEKVNEKSDYGKDTDNVFNDEDGSDDDEIDEEERKEEEEKASDAFDQVDTEATGKIPSSKFENIFDALGTVYSADEHTRTIKKLDKNGYIFKKDFVAWYLNWIFADDDDEDDEEETSAAPDFDPNAAKKSADEIKNAWKKFEAPPGSWKCSVCMIVNKDENASRCVSCESPNPNAKSEVNSEETKPLSFGSGGFKFGVTEAAPSNGFGVKQAEANTNSFSSISLGAGNSISLTGSKGFTFPMPTSASKTSSDSTADAKPATPNAPAAKPAFSFGATSTLKAATSYPPDTSTKPPVTFGATTAKPASPAYPPDTSTKPAVAFGVTAAKPTSSAYPPDTSTKPAVAFGATVAKTTSSAYPPDTNTKPAVDFGATATKTSSAYPPDTSTKPAVAFGASAAKSASSAYPPDTSTKPAVAFGFAPAKTATSAYPPDTSTKPAVAFGATTTKSTSSAYPPDTSTKPAVAFGATAAKPANSASPPDTSSKAPVAFGFGSSSSTPSLSFGAKTTPSFSTDTSNKSVGGFGTITPKVVSSTPSQETGNKPPTSFTPAPALDTSKNTLKFGGPQSKTPAAFSTGTVSSTQGTKLPTGTVQLQKALPASAFEGEMWKLINGFDQSFQKIRQKDDTFIAQKNQQEAPFVATLKELRSKVLNMCEVVDKLNDSYEKIEKDTQVIMGNASDVDAQSKCSDNLLKAMNDKNLVAQLEDQPLDQRSQNKREALRSQLETIERYSVDLEKHVASLKRPGQAQSARYDELFRVFCIEFYCSSMNDTTHLFRILKINYETSKREYNRVLELEDQFKRLEMKTQLQSRIQKTSTPIPTKELLKQLRQEEQSQRTLKSNLQKWTSEPIKPRVIANTVRRRPLRETISELRPAPEVPARVASKLMFGANTTIPSQATESGNLSFQPVPTKPKPLAKVALSTESETTKSVSFAPSTKPAALNFAKSTTLKSMPSLDSLSFGKKREESASDEPEEKSNSPRARKLSTGSKSGTPERSTGFKLSTPTVPTVKPLDFGAKPKETPKEMPSFSFSVSAKPTEKQPSPFSTPAPAATPAINYVERLKAFYAAYAPGKSTEAAEKLLEKHKGKEEEVFQKLLVKYISDKATLEHVKEFLKTGNVPESLKNLAKPADTSAATTTAPPAFGAKPPTAPVAASPSPFGTATASTTTTAASPFGSATTASSPFGSTAATQATPATAAASPFGSTSAWPSTPASQPVASPFGGGSTSSFGVDYRSKVVEFYKKHNPDKLAEVDTVLQKYKGKEEELLRKLEAKYNKPQATGFGSASPFGAPANSGFGAAASPFGSTTQQPANAGFGAAASPFNTPAQAPPSTPSFGSQASPFGASSSGFASASPFGAASTPAAPAFGATTSLGGNSPFGAASATPAFGSTTPMGAATSTPAFGATTALGGSTTPAFGSTTALGGTAAPAFGSASQLGGGFGSSAPAFGAPSALGSGGAAAPAAGGGFSAFATSSTPSFGFGGQAGGGGFGGQATSGGGGGGFGQASSGGFGSGFGQTSGFASSSFTQARR
ncbi:hypothetical protein AeNC1_002794 [Aphanomyces euteiches]|nr:hypothetical protein AeNC1_002794 [Aphanomyces euteiches]